MCVIYERFYYDTLTEVASKFGPAIRSMRNKYINECVPKTPTPAPARRPKKKKKVVKKKSVGQVKLPFIDEAELIKYGELVRSMLFSGAEEAHLTTKGADLPSQSYIFAVGKTKRFSRMLDKLKYELRNVPDIISMFPKIRGRAYSSSNGWVWIIQFDGSGLKRKPLF